MFGSDLELGFLSVGSNEWSNRLFLFIWTVISLFLLNPSLQTEVCMMGLPEPHITNCLPHGPWLLYILTSVWVLCTPNAGWNCHFQHFFVLKSWKKQEICSKTLQKTRFLKFAPKLWSTVLFSKKLAFFFKNTSLPTKNSRPAFWCKIKKSVLCKILLQISCFFKLFAV